MASDPSLPGFPSTCEALFDPSPVFSRAWTISPREFLTSFGISMKFVATNASRGRRRRVAKSGAHALKPGAGTGWTTASTASSLCSTGLFIGQRLKPYAGLEGPLGGDRFRSCRKCLSRGRSCRRDHFLVATEVQTAAFCRFLHLRVVFSSGCASNRLNNAAPPVLTISYGQFFPSRTCPERFVDAESAGG